MLAVTIGGGDLLGWTDSPPQSPRVQYALFGLALLALAIAVIYFQFSGGLDRAKGPDPEAALPPGSVLEVRLRYARPDLGCLIFPGVIAFTLVPAAVIKIVWILLGRPSGSNLWEAPVPPQSPPSGGDWFSFAVMALPGVTALVVFLVVLVMLVPALRGARLPRVEVSRFPLQRGRSYHLFVSQPGPVRLRSWTVTLICREEKLHPYMDGVKPKYQTEKRDVFVQHLIHNEQLYVPSGKAHEVRTRLLIPEDAPSSSAKPEHTITWSIVVTPEGRYWLAPALEFPVAVT
jgi:hypothetical protein